MVKKFQRYFWHDPRTWQTDGQTGRWTNTQTPHDSIDRACIASRGKNPSIYNNFPVIRTTIAKNRHFTYPGLHFLFALGTPLWQSRKTLHEWKQNSVVAKPLAACTYVSAIVSELYDRCLSQCVSPKNRYFATFLFPLGTPLGQSR